ncbi:MAG: hypothetical protein RI930_380 [Pseudomonadota bacterium]|jgi:single-strand DNA-binding protein
MADSLNKVSLIGNVGDDPNIVEFSNGGMLAGFSLATSHSWIDNKTKEKKTETEWHKITIYGEGLVGIIKKLNVSKGTKLYLEGKLTNRKWEDKDGNKRVTTEIVLQGYNCAFIVLDKKTHNDEYNSYDKYNSNDQKQNIKTDAFDEFNGLDSFDELMF